MERVELITVERTSRLSKASEPDWSLLVVHPNFSLSQTGKGFSARTEPVTILRPDGREFEATAEIGISHLNIPTSTSIDERWRVVVTFRGLTSEDVPDGSRIFISRDTRDTLFPGRTT